MKFEIKLSVELKTSKKKSSSPKPKKEIAKNFSNISINILNHLHK